MSQQMLTSAGGFQARIGVDEKGSQYQRTTKGTQHISEYLTSLFPDSVKLNSPVTEIDQNEDSVTVKTANGSWTGKAVIVTIGTIMLDTIQFTPPLPLAQRLSYQRAWTGYYTKVVLFYKSAWWREKGLSGASISPGLGESMQVTFDQVSGEAYAITAFVVGQKGIMWGAEGEGDEKKRHQKIVDDVARVFGCEEAKNPIDIIEEAWADEQWSRGAPGAFWGPGQLEVASAFSQPTGRIFWGGTDNAEHHVGYMEGAVQAGEARAADVLKLLK